jgi:hypothetical protein
LKKLLFIFLSAPFLALADNSYFNYFVTVHNIGTNTLGCSSAIYFSRINQVGGSDANLGGTTIPNGLAAGASETFEISGSSVSGGDGASGNAVLCSGNWYSSGGKVLYTGAPVVYESSSSTVNADVDLDLYVDDSCDISASLTSSTNYTFCAHNTMSVKANAVWTFNGSVVKTEQLAPGASDCWTSPNIQIFPNPQNCSENTSVTAVGINGSNPIDADTNGTIIFNPSPTSSTNFTISGGTGSGATNDFTVTSPPSLGAPTNLVTFPTPTGTASESTLASGFQLLHQDNLNVISGEKILNDSILQITNQLGQVITETISNVSLDGTWFPRIVSAITNLANPTNSVASIIVTNPPLNLTNYASETTLDAITNGLFGGVVNSNNWGSDFLTDAPSILTSDMTNLTVGFDGATNAASAEAATAGTTQTIETGLSTWISGFVNPFTGMEDYYSPVAMTYTFNFGSSSKTMDFDPLHNADLAALISSFRALITWGIALKFLLRIAEDAIKGVMVLNDARGITPSNIQASIKKMN